MNNNFSETLNSIYTKKIIRKEELFLDGILTILKWLSYDKDNINVTRTVTKFQYISPIFVYYLLYLGIPKKYKVPYLSKYNKDKKESKENKDFSNIKEMFEWSNREFNFNKSILERLYENS